MPPPGEERRNSGDVAGDIAGGRPGGIAGYTVDRTEEHIADCTVECTAGCTVDCFGRRRVHYMEHLAEEGRLQSPMIEHQSEVQHCLAGHRAQEDHVGPQRVLQQVLEHPA